jgi:TonB family protein
MAHVRRFAVVAAVVGCVAMPVLAQAGQQPYKVKDPGVVAPAVIKEVHPKYTAEAKEKKIQGTVELEAVVLEDGTVGDITVKKSLDATYGLDQAAVAALVQWQFSPGQKDGKAVKVVIDVEMSFTIK